MGRILLIPILWLLLAACGLNGQNQKPLSPNVEMPDKFTQFTFGEQCINPDPLMTEIIQANAEHSTILDLLQGYSDQIAKDPDVKSPYFSRLQRIFECGLAPETMSGYYHGAVVAFRNQALLNLFDINSLNLKWPLARLISPWTGKTFESMDEGKLKTITDGYLTDSASVAWGSNTYTSRTVKQRIAVDAMYLLGMELIDAPPGEIAAHDYETKGFFFIGSQTQSINPENRGRRVYQFNYRWPTLKTFVPDNYCIDEIVQIAEGLYLGQLIYATEMIKAYDPHVDPMGYKYKNFGFWLLMDDEWQQRREEILFDMN